jgi:hypothetical protein
MHISLDPALLSQDAKGDVVNAALKVLGTAVSGAPGSPRSPSSPSKRDWSEDKNLALVKTFGSGKITQSKFVNTYNEALSDNSNKFDMTIEAFMTCLGGPAST